MRPTIAKAQTRIARYAFWTVENAGMDVELSLRLWEVYELGNDVDGNENVKIAN